MEDTRTAPRIDLLAGGFFLVWAAIGWVSYAGNAALRASLSARADPGPALVPLIVLVLLSLGGGALLAKGLWRATRPGVSAAEGPAAEGLPPAAAHLLPLGFAAMLGALAFALPFTGFLPAAILFCLFWLWALSSGGHSAAGWALRLLAAGVIGGGIYLVFAVLLRVPLPG